MARRPRKSDDEYRYREDGCEYLDDDQDRDHLDDSTDGDDDMATGTAYSRPREDDLISIYKRDMARTHRRLSREEEHDLAIVVWEWKKVEQRMDGACGESVEVIGEYEIVNNSPAYLAVKSARTTLIESCTPMVMRIAGKYSRGRGDRNSELISEANVKLVECVDDYDPFRGVRFSTFAYRVVWNHLHKYLTGEKAREADASFEEAEVEEAILSMPAAQRSPQFDEQARSAFRWWFDGQLTRTQRDILVMRGRAKASEVARFDEIGRQMRMPRREVMRLVRDAESKLPEILRGLVGI